MAIAAWRPRIEPTSSPIGPSTPRARSSMCWSSPSGNKHAALKLMRKRLEFSARLFFHCPRSCRRSIPSSRTAALYDRKSSVTNRSGTKAFLFRRIEFRVGIHLGDVVEESDGDLMGDGVNIAARLEGIVN